MERMAFVVTCGAPDAVLCEEWEDIPLEDQVRIDVQNGLPCDGGGVPGYWCRRCVYENSRLEEEYD
jgi:hypothetical protein